MTDVKETWEERRDRLATEQADQVLEATYDDTVASVAYDVFRKGFTEGRADTLKQVEGLILMAKELRIYCLGSDASTENMLSRFDQALAQFRKETEGME